jgi:hypothetical protein
MPHSDAGAGSLTGAGTAAAAADTFALALAGERFVNVAAGFAATIEGEPGGGDVFGAGAAAAKFAGINVPFLRLPLE